MNGLTILLTDRKCSRRTFLLEAERIQAVVGGYTKKEGTSVEYRKVIADEGHDDDTVVTYKVRETPSEIQRILRTERHKLNTGSL